MTWFVQTALGLHYMHSHKVLHRDIKTQNVFIMSSGRVVLGDLGISKVNVKSDDQPDLTQKNPVKHVDGDRQEGTTQYSPQKTVVNISKSTRATLLSKINGT